MKIEKPNIKAILSVDEVCQLVADYCCEQIAGFTPQAKVSLIYKGDTLDHVEVQEQ